MSKGKLRRGEGGGRNQVEMTKTWQRTSEPVPDFTDIMNETFFGTANLESKTYDLAGRQPRVSADMSIGFDDITRSNSGMLTQEWLEEARRVMAASPARYFGSPRFAATQQASSPLPYLERDLLSRSARRYRKKQKRVDLKALKKFERAFLSSQS
ncbi:uncharacterized protein LOC129319901 [Prosopis cineraria]|uniref:uncharacterized protein LOC129319901 n=1 Tax=Prosopis cineraria TaxID=364024 RepID=UPI002410A1D1|nr:uncharacterized protein LOC129319901 [Prosopis cineraria]